MWDPLSTQNMWSHLIHMTGMDMNVQLRIFTLKRFEEPKQKFKKVFKQSLIKLTSLLVQLVFFVLVKS